MAATPTYDSVSVGDALPPLALPPLTRATLALYAGASGDHNPIHIDVDYARAAGMPDVFAHGMLSMAWLGRLLTNWTPQRNLREFSVRFSAMTQVGERIVCTGRVTEKLVKNGERLVRIGLATANEAGEVKVSGDAVVALPWVVRAQPRVEAHRGQRGHPQRGAEASVADGGGGGASAGAFAGLAECGDDADVGRRRAGGAEVGGIAEFGDEPGRSIGADAVDAGEQRADFVHAQGGVDVMVELAQAPTQGVEILAGIAHLHAVGCAVMVADRTLGRVDAQAGELGTHWVSAVVAQFGEAFDRHAAEGGGGGIVMEDCAGQFAVEAFDVAGELGEAEVDQAVKLAHAITEVLHQSVTQANELAQLLGGGVGQPRGRGALLCGEAGDAQGVDGVGLGALQILAGEAMGAQRIEQRHREAACGQRGKRRSG